MTTAEIQQKADRELSKFETAKKIRELLDAASKAYGPDDWDSDDCETEILEMVTGEA